VEIFGDNGGILKQIYENLKEKIVIVNLLEQFIAVILELYALGVPLTVD